MLVQEPPQQGRAAPGAAADDDDRLVRAARGIAPALAGKTADPVANLGRQPSEPAGRGGGRAYSPSGGTAVPVPTTTVKSTGVVWFGSSAVTAVTWNNFWSTSRVVGLSSPAPFHAVIVVDV